jgi:hypothetical protein
MQAKVIFSLPDHCSLSTPHHARLHLQYDTVPYAQAAHAPPWCLPSLDQITYDLMSDISWLLTHAIAACPRATHACPHICSWLPALLSQSSNMKQATSMNILSPPWLSPPLLLLHFEPARPPRSQSTTRQSDRELKSPSSSTTSSSRTVEPGHHV